MLTLDSVGRVLCWAPIVVAVYSYVGFPVLLTLSSPMARAYDALRDKSKRRGRRDPTASSELPAVAVVFSAYNEQQHVEARIANLLAQDYPTDRLTVYVGSDGSKDDTDRILREVRHPRVRAHCFAANRGKASVLNDVVRGVSEPIVVFTDANTEFAPDAVRRLVAAFDDERIGCVCGELLLGAAAGDNQDQSYWSFERFLKVCESGIGGLLGANGGIYAIRRHLFRELPPDTICDDFLIAMRVREAGSRLVYHPAAVAFEGTPPGIADEFKRRKRIGVGNYQILFRYPQFFFRLGLATAFTYPSHKVIRWLTPQLMILCLAGSILAARSPYYLAFAAVQIAGCVVLGSLFAARDRMRLSGLVGKAVFVFALNLAFLVASVEFVRGKSSGAWERSGR